MGVRISKEFGVNPSVLRCVCCGKEYGIGLFGTAIKDKRTGRTVEAPPAMAHGLCEDCQKVVDQEGLLIIEVRDGETGNNPYRTGRICGITKEAKERMFHDVNSPIVYMEQSLYSQIFNQQG
ncbi:MAG: hypothetical protein IJ640_13540 [Prevotella sp.]|nr:hypothetical protein [Prevotella sp.]MBR1527655.1 hypothetical protein [Prevotella sp.]